MKSTLHNTVHRTTSPKFSSVTLHNQPFSRYCTFQDFPIDFHVKISKCHKFLILADHQKIYKFMVPYDCLMYHKVWLRSDKNCRSTVLKFPAPYGPVLTKFFKVPYNLQFWEITKKPQPIFPHDQYTNNKVCLKSDENWERSRVLKLVKLEILQSVPNDPKPNSRNWASKVTYIHATVVPRVPNFCPFRSTMNRFQDIHFRIFPLTPMLKLEVPQNFYFLTDRQ